MKEIKGNRTTKPTGHNFDDEGVSWQGTEKCSLPFRGRRYATKISAVQQLGYSGNTSGSILESNHWSVER